MYRQKHGVRSLTCLNVLYWVHCWKQETNITVCTLNGCLQGHRDMTPYSLVIFIGIAVRTSNTTLYIHQMIWSSITDKTLTDQGSRNASRRPFNWLIPQNKDVQDPTLS